MYLIDGIFDYHGPFVIKTRPCLDDCPPVVSSTLYPFKKDTSQLQNPLFIIDYEPCRLKDIVLSSKVSFLGLFSSIFRGDLKQYQDLCHPSEVLVNYPWDIKLKYLKSHLGNPPNVCNRNCCP